MTILTKKIILPILFISFVLSACAGTTWEENQKAIIGGAGGAAAGRHPGGAGGLDRRAAGPRPAGRASLRHGLLPPGATRTTATPEQSPLLVPIRPQTGSIAGNTGKRSTLTAKGSKPTVQLVVNLMGAGELCDEIDVERFKRKKIIG